MEILKKIDTLEIEVDLSAPEASKPYTLSYEDLVTGEIFSASAVSTANKVVTFTLDDRYLVYAGYLDATMVDASSQYVLSLGIDIVKPYCDIDLIQSNLSITDTKAIQCEKIARLLIESKAGSFQYMRKQNEVIGMGMDYLPVGERIQNLYRVWVNGELVHDSENPDLQTYRIGKDRMSIEPLEDGNFVDYPIVWRDRYLSPTFNEGFNYRIDADYGYKTIPEDVQEACELIFQDVSNNTMRFINRNIQEFDNREFKIKFADGFNSGTGNLLADNLLAKYQGKIVPGVL